MNSKSVDQDIQLEVERLRTEYSETQDLYREVCVLLFFRFGITPTANKLYQFVRKGSMSAPAEALARFWENLRDKSRVRIESPDLPEELRVAAGDLTAALWTRARAEAGASLEAFRDKASEETAAARQEQSAAETRLQAISTKLESTTGQLESSRTLARTLENDLVAERTTRSALETRLQEADCERSALRDSILVLRRDFAAETEQLRASLGLAEERLRAAQEHARGELERERASVARLEEELATARLAAAGTEDGLRAELRSAHGEIAQARQDVGALEGSVRELQALRQDLRAQLVSLRAGSTDSLTRLAIALRDVETAGFRIRELEAENAALRTSAALLEAAQSGTAAGVRNQKRIRRIVPSERGKSEP